MSGIELHPDFGFGITGESYYKSATFLYEHHYEHYQITQQREVPQNYLFRHSIELFLKSLIIIFHRKLKINYDQNPYDSNEPKMQTKVGWRSLYTCHWLDELYSYWLNKLLLPNTELLNQIADKGDWQETKEISDLFPIICKYDRDSSYFRYPVTKDTSLDDHKFTMKKFQAPNTLEKLITEMQTEEGRNDFGKSLFIKIDENENITHAFQEDEKVLENVTDALKKVSHYFYCIHIMTRMTMCGGM